MVGGLRPSVSCATAELILRLRTYLVGLAPIGLFVSVSLGGHVALIFAAWAIQILVGQIPLNDQD